MCMTVLVHSKLVESTTHQGAQLVAANLNGTPVPPGSGFTAVTVCSGGATASRVPPDVIGRATAIETLLSLRSPRENR
jgi:hypothetical protein